MVKRLVLLNSIVGHGIALPTHSNAIMEHQPMTIYLYVKTHLKTGLKYLGYTKNDPYVYKGSGTYWNLHLDKHGNDVWTNIIFQSEIKEEIREMGLYYSRLWNIVDSKEWANLIEENAAGSANKGEKMWITDGNTDAFVTRKDSIPSGWRQGRSKCVFNDPEKQKEFSNRCDSETKSKAAKQCWKDGKYDERVVDWSKGENNPAKRPEVRAKIGKSNSEIWKNRTHPAKGKPLPIETREKISKTLLARNEKV